MKELLENPIVLIILLGIILLVLPSPILKRTNNKIDDIIKEAEEKKSKDIAFKVLTNFAEDLKKSEYDGNIDLTSNNQIDHELNKYKISLDLAQSKSKSKINKHPLKWSIYIVK